MSNPIIVGVDVSKGYGDFLVIDSNRKVLENLFQLDDTRAGHDRLTELLIQLKKTHKSTRILLVVESTGGLEDNWLRLAKDTKLASFVEPYRLNPKIIHHEYRVQNRNSISDAVSAQTIAFHVAKNLDSFTPNEVVENQAYGAARSLIRHITTLDENCTEHKNGLQILLYQYLPSLVPMIPKAWSAYFLNILITHGSKRGIQLAASQGFKQIKRVPSGKAELMHHALQNGVDMNETRH
jgi:transposase